MIVKAKKDNISNLSNLIFNAIKDVANILTGEDKEDKILQTIDQYIVMDINRLSYNNIWIYEIQNRVVGLIISYDSNRVEELDSPILEHLATKNIFIDAFDKECFADEFYIDTISVFEDFQGKGIAKELFSFIEKHAKKLEYKKLSLLVDFDNIKALKLYEKVGFKKNTILKISNHNYHHMIKIIF